jgi:hypothetical protein
MSLAWSNLRFVGAEIKAISESTEGKRLQVPLGNETRPFLRSARGLVSEM